MSGKGVNNLIGTGTLNKTNYLIPLSLVHVKTMVRLTSSNPPVT